MTTTVKKLLCSMLAAMLIFGAMPMTAMGLTSLGHEYGDANCDGKVNGKDSLTLKKFNAGITVEQWDEQAADCNNDGKVNGKDSMELKRFLAGRIKVLGTSGSATTSTTAPTAPTSATTAPTSGTSANPSVTIPSFTMPSTATTSTSTVTIPSTMPTGSSSTTHTTSTTTTTVSTTTTSPISTGTTITTATPSGTTSSVEDISKVVTAIEGVEAYDDTNFDKQSSFDIASATAYVEFNGNSYTVGKETYTDKVYKIENEGTYVFAGTWNDGQIYVNYSGNVQIVLNGVDITCSTSAPIAIFGSKKKVITVAAGTTNKLTDASTYTTFYNTDNDEPNAALFSKKALTINGTGTLDITANYNNGINCKDGFKILGSTVKVNAANGKGINAKDYAILKNAGIEITSSEDGINSCNDPETDTTTGETTDGYGYIYLENCNATIKAQQDALQAYTYVYTVGGNYNLTSGLNGSAGSYDTTDTTSRKGIKCEQNVYIKSGTITIDAFDDAVNCNDTLIISDGSTTIKTKSDGVQATGNLVMSGGTLNITTSGTVSSSSSGGGNNPWGGQGGGSSSSTTDGSSKGVKADNDVKITGGTLILNTTDHAIHSAKTMEITGGSITISSGQKGISSHGNLTIDGNSTVINVTKATEGIESKETMNINGGMISVNCSDDGLNTGGGGSDFGAPTDGLNHDMIFNGGYVYVIAKGDGVDSNASILMNGGKVVVMYTGTGGNSPVDSQSGVTFTGGTMLAVGSSSAMWNDISGHVTGDYIINTSLGSVSNGSTVAVVDGSNVLTAVKIASGVQTSLGIVYMTDKTSSISTCKFNVNGTCSGSFDSFGVAMDGTVTGGTSVDPGTSTGGGGGGGGGGGWNPFG